MHGVLVVDKPSGPTSHDVVSAVRRAAGIDRAGHTGTLDPLASGVLPLVVGRATRLAPFFTSSDKEYIALVRFGATTATYDAERIGESERPQAVVSLDEAKVREALVPFVGTYLQTPPPFSAKKIGGTPAYKLARREKPVKLDPVEVTVRELELRRLENGLAELRVVCSTGFYVRSLAHDLGQRLGCGAYLEGLRRTRAGDFVIAQATPLDVLCAEGREACARIIPPERLLNDLPAVVLNAGGVRKASHGNEIGRLDVMSGTSDASAGPVRLLDPDGGLLAIAFARDGGLLHPAVVLV
jgi:tRNA pseudouridine55 synthase